MFKGRLLLSSGADRTDLLASAKRRRLLHRSITEMHESRVRWPGGLAEMLDIRHFEVARETGCKCIVGLFLGTPFQQGGKFVPKTVPQYTWQPSRPGLSCNLKVANSHPTPCSSRGGCPRDWMKLILKSVNTFRLQQIPYLPANSTLFFLQLQKSLWAVPSSLCEENVRNDSIGRLCSPHCKGHPRLPLRHRFLLCTDGSWFASDLGGFPIAPCSMTLYMLKKGRYVDGLGEKLVPYFLSFRYCLSCTCTLLQARLKPLPRRSLPVLAKSAFFIFDRTATLRFCEIVAKVCPANWNDLWIIVRRPAIFT